jgi:hypothetical protein
MATPGMNGNDNKRSARNILLAVVLGVIVLTIYVTFILRHL